VLPVLENVNRVQLPTFGLPIHMATFASKQNFASEFMKRKLAFAGVN